MVAVQTIDNPPSRAGDTLETMAPLCDVVPREKPNPCAYLYRVPYGKQYPSCPAVEGSYRCVVGTIVGMVVAQVVAGVECAQITPTY